MVIREKQQRVFNEKFSTSFEDRMVVHLRAVFPHECGAQTDVQLRETVHRGIDRAAQYGVDTERDVCKFIDLMMIHGPEFDQLPWAAKFLNDQVLRDGTARIERVYVEARQQP